MTKVSQQGFDHNPAEDEAELMEQLRHILLSEDRAALKALQETLEQEEKLSEKVSPIVLQHLAFIKDNFKKEYGVFVKDIAKNEILNSKDEIVDLIAPSLGTMIKKYITTQFQKLKENIDNQINNVRSKVSMRGFFSRFFGPSETDIILSHADQPIIQEIYLIQRDSGLLLGNYSKQLNLHQDVVAGMLTAIKSFAEDALEIKYENLEMIQYDNYKIFLQNFSNFYFAVAISGSISTAEKEVLSNKIITFASNSVPLNIKEVDSELTKHISASLKEDFEHFSLIS